MRRVPVADVYQNAIAAITIVLLSTGVTVYLVIGVGVSIPAFAWLALLGALALPIALRPQAVLNALWSRLPLWSGLYFLATLAAYLASSQSGTAATELRLRLLTCALLPLFALIFASETAIRTARLTLAACVLIGVGFNAYELVQPGLFSTVLGRSAGLYMNPNISAKALVVGMTLATGVLAPRWREAFVVVTGLGVALTLSRGLAICYLCSVTALYLFGVIHAGRLVTRAALLVPTIVIALLAAAGFERTVSAARLLVEKGVLDRIVNPAVAIGGGDYSTNLRMEEARAAWDQFRDHPIVGNGVASTLEWEVHSSTHNIYLRHLAEYGIGGIVLYPLLVALVIIGARPPARNTLIPFATATLIAGMFSHNVLDERDSLVATGLAAAISVHSRVPRSRGIPAVRSAAL